MSKRYSERILDYLRRPEYQPMKAARLARAMGIAEAEHGDFHDAVDSLRRVGRVVVGTENAVMLPHPPNQITGTFRGNPRGFGFVVPDSPTHVDVYIPKEATLDAVTGDKVLIRVQSRGKREGKDSFGGTVLKILERGRGEFVGALRQEGSVWFVQPDGNTLHVPIIVNDVGAKGARAGDQVVVEIVRYPSEGRPAKGVIVERIGQGGEPNVDLRSVIRQFQLPEEFPGEVMAEAREQARQFDPDRAAKSREDLSGRVTITIDPTDAKDYDDAITLERIGGGAEIAGRDSRAGEGARRDSRTSSSGTSREGARRDSRASSSRTSSSDRGANPRPQGSGPVWELGVHIADVSSFVREGGAIDTEAKERGTSVYFPGHVIPMLPEVLSNGLCSLQEGEPRLCKSAFIQLDAGGAVVRTRFANTIIRSTKRLTYDDATNILAGKTAGFPKEVVQIVREMEKLARIIQARRVRDGMISLELPEVRLVLDEDGRMIDAQPEDTAYSHTIIEMFMVEANEAAARLMDKLAVPCIRRIHPEPDEGSLESMARFMRAAGFGVPKKITPGDLQALLAPLKGKPEAYAVNLAVLKSMEMAEYSPKSVGHFALASRHYTHFTSPIRRYADLMVHRLLQKHIEGDLGGRQKKRLEEVPDEEALIEAGRRLSYLSRRAESAERELKTLKVLQLLSEHVGGDFEGVVTGVANFGLFVQHPKYLIDGLLRLEDLGDDWWEVDTQLGRVVGARTRQSFTLGTLVHVKIAEVDLPARQMKLVLMEPPKRSGRQGAEQRPGGQGQRPGRQDQRRQKERVGGGGHRSKRHESQKRHGGARGGRGRRR